jgi:hypothetical protein
MAPEAHHMIGVCMEIADGHETPDRRLLCDRCGIHGWYPWARGTDLPYAGFTALNGEQHPALIDLLVGAPFATASGWRTLAGVADVWGRVVLHDTGVRASHARVRALIDPWSMAEHVGVRERFPTHTAEGTARLAQDTTVAADVNDLPIITFTEAFRLEREWGLIADRYPAGRKA